MNWRGTATTVLTLLAITAGAVYLVARATTLGDGWLLLLSIPLYLAEAAAFAQFALFAFVAWHAREHIDELAARSQKHRRNQSTSDTDLVVDVGVHEVAALERTLVGARTVTSVAKTIVVDRRHRQEIAETAGALGATYVIDDRPPEHWVDVLLDVSDSEFVAWLSAGQVPMSDFVDAGCARLTDPKVAVWQSSIGLLNSDSFAHVQRGRDEDAVLRTLISPGLDLFGAAPWDGPGSVVRRHAIELLGVSGALDAAPLGQRLVMLHRSGWTSAFDSSVHVRSIAPDDLDEYLIARNARARAAFGVFATRANPFLQRGLSPVQRISHLAHASLFTTGIRQAVAVLVLVATLLTGALPLTGNLAPVLTLWAVAAITATASRRLLAGDAMRIGDWTRHAWRTLGADVAAAIHLSRPTKTAEARSAQQVTGIRSLGRLRLLTGIVIALDLALLARGATIIFENALPAFSLSERLLVISVGLFALVPMVDVLHLVVSRRQRRKSFRLAADLAVVVGEQRTRTIDLSTSGVGVLLPFSPAIDTHLGLRLALPDQTGAVHDIELTGVVRAANLDEGGQVRVGLEFIDVPAQARHALIAFCMTDRSLSGSPREVHEPHGLVIDRPADHRVLSVRALTAVASIMSVAMLFFGPSEASASTTEAEVFIVRLLDVEGVGISGADVRFHIDDVERWQVAGTTDDEGEVLFRASLDALDTSTAAVEIDWANGRKVIALEASETIVSAARVESGDAEVEAINTGRGWDVFVEGMHVLPGRVAIRFADATVLKTELEPGNTLDASTGIQVRNEEVRRTEAAPSTTEPSTTTTSPTTTTSSTSSSTTTTSLQPTTSAEPVATTEESSTTEETSTTEATEKPTTTTSGETPSTSEPEEAIR